MKKICALLLSLLLLSMLPAAALAATAGPTCPKCGSGYYDPINGGWIVSYPSCTQTGIQCVGQCEYCGYVYETIPALGHQWDTGVVTKQPTCTEPGVRERHCTRAADAYGTAATTCSAVWYQPIDPLDHDWGEWVRVKEPTPTEQGEEKRTCKRCEIEEIRYIDYIPPTTDRVTFVKALNSTPKNGAYFTYGEWISYSLQLRYMEARGEVAHVFTDIVFTDPLLNEGQTKPQGSAAEPLDSLGLHYAYCVTAEDVERGYIENTATASYGFVGEDGQHSITSDTITVQTGKGERETGGDASSGDVSIRKSVVSTPKNGEFYVEGETIDFAITVSIPANDTIGGATLWDSLADAPTGTWSDTASGFTVTLPLYYTVTAGDVEAGEVSNVAWLEWKGKNGAADGYLYSNYVFVPTGIDENAAPAWPTIEKVVYEFSHPANGLFYVEGETVLFDVIVRNPLNGRTMSNVTIHDFCNDGTELYECERDIAPGDFYIAGFSFTVTAENAEMGYLLNEAFMTYQWSETERYATCPVFCQVPCGVEKDASAYAFLEKKVLGGPNNGMYYVPGEMVSYQITLTNISEELLQDVAIYDFDQYMGGTMALNRGASIETIYSAPVTDGDAAVGWKNNMASAIFYIFNKDGDERYTVYSNMVTVPVGFEGGFGVITDLSVSKTETSTPKNGSYYTLDETITYDITVTNSGETSFDEVIVYDALVPGSGEIAAIENFFPGSSRSYSFSHTVHQGDIDTGYVVNSASAMGYSAAGSYFSGSNLVVSDTDGDEDSILCPPIMITPPPPGTFEGPGTLPGGDGKGCDCTLVQQSDGSWVYELGYCSVHNGTKGAVAKMLTTGNAATVFPMAKELWEKDIDELYEQLAGHGDSLAKANLMTSKVSFYAMLANQEALLNALYPNDPAAAANAVLTTMEEHANVLCYELHNAPAARNDRLTANIPSPLLLTGGESCAVTREPQKDNTVTKSLLMCEDHTLIDANGKILLGYSTPIRAWQSIAKLWKMELQNSARALAAALPEETAQLAYAYYRSAAEHANAREALLTALYGSRSEAASETVSKLLRELVAEICALTPETADAPQTESAGFRPKKS